MSDKPIVFLDGPGVYLRPPQESDVQSFVRWFNDPEIRIFIKMYLPMFEMEEREWIKGVHKTKKENLVLVIVDKENGMPIGTMGLHRISHKNGTVTTGAVIGEKEY